MLKEFVFGSGRRSCKEWHGDEWGRQWGRVSIKGKDDFFFDSHTFQKYKKRMKTGGDGKVKEEPNSFPSYRNEYTLHCPYVTLKERNLSSKIVFGGNFLTYSPAVVSIIYIVYARRLGEVFSHNGERT